MLGTLTNIITFAKDNLQVIRYSTEAVNYMSASVHKYKAQQ